MMVISRLIGYAVWTHGVLEWYKVMRHLYLPRGKELYGLLNYRETFGVSADL
jgi:hypothetical protein